MENNKDLGFGGLFKGIENLIELATKLQESKGLNGEGEINLDHIKKGMKGVYGFTINTAVGGGKSGEERQTVETFGNIKKTPDGPKVNEEREPIIDIFDEDTKEIVILVELPGVDEEDIKLNLNDDILEIVAINKNRNYKKEVLLSVIPPKQVLKQKFLNGILEIKIEKEIQKPKTTRKKK
jgi:HSP20 family protein